MVLHVKIIVDWGTTLLFFLCQHTELSAAIFHMKDILNSEYSEWLPYEECCWYASANKNKMLPCCSYRRGYWLNL